MSEEKSITKNPKPAVVGSKKEEKTEKYKTNLDLLPKEDDRDVRELPITSRMLKRQRQINELAQANSRKISNGPRPIIRTEQPLLQLTPRDSVKTSPDRGVITYGVYALDDNNNKLKHEVYSQPDPDTGKKRLVSSSPLLVKTVEEVYEFKKPMKMNVYEEEYDVN